MKTGHRALGYGAVIAAAALWGLGGTVAKMSC